MDEATQQQLGRVALAELTSGELDAAQLQAWATELVELTDDLEVRLKGAGAQRADQAAVTLAQGLQALASGAAAAMQVRYTFEERQWADTLVPRPGGGVRLLRAALPEAP